MSSANSIRHQNNPARASIAGAYAILGQALKCGCLALILLLPVTASAQGARVDDARRVSAAASAESRTGALALFSEAFKRLQANDLQAAVGLYTRGLMVDPANAPARYYLGLAHTGLGNGPAARTQYEMAVALAPESETGKIAKNILLEIDEQRSLEVDPCY